MLIPPLPRDELGRAVLGAVSWAMLCGFALGYMAGSVG